MTDFRLPPYEVDILVRGSGNLDLTWGLLESIQQNTPAPTYHVTYVDNGSAEFPDFFLRLAGYGATLVSLPINMGSVRAINAGLQLAMLSPAPFVLLLDNDTEVPAGDRSWLARWVEYFDDPKVGAAGAVTDYVAGTQNGLALPDAYNRDWQAGDVKGLKEPPAPPVLVSFGLMLRKAAILDVEWFDEDFEPGNFEDYDYSLRLRAAGWELRLARSVWLHHRGSQTFGEQLPELMRANGQKFVNKWGAARLNEFGIQVRRAG